MDEIKKYKWRLGEILIQNGWLTWEQLEKALKSQHDTGEPMEDILVDKGYITRKQAKVLNLGEIMVRQRWLTWENLTEALRLQKLTNRILGEILVERGFATRKNLYRALALQFNMAFADFEKVKVPAEVVAIVEKRLAEEYGVMPLAKQGSVLLIAIPDPMDVKAESALGKYLPAYEIKTALALPEEIREAIKRYYPQAGS